MPEKLMVKPMARLRAASAGPPVKQCMMPGQQIEVQCSSRRANVSDQALRV
jgi:hypothetical protein